jgi:hypothetical protein
MAEEFLRSEFEYWRELELIAALTAQTLLLFIRIRRLGVIDVEHVDGNRGRQFETR